MKREQIKAQGGAHEIIEEELEVAATVQVSSVDALLDEIDTVLEANAQSFVQGFVQKGGQ